MSTSALASCRYFTENFWHIVLQPMVLLFSLLIMKRIDSRSKGETLWKVWKTFCRGRENVKALDGKWMGFGLDWIGLDWDDVCDVVR